MTSFVSGQRWISDTESEQGLGTVLTFDSRMVTLLFPATGETRLYSLHNCPLSRVQFNPGDKVESHEGWIMTVTEVIEEHGLHLYKGLLPDGEPKELPESELGNFIHFNKPQDRMLAGQIDQNSNFSLRYKTLQNNSRLRSTAMRGLIGPRTSLIPHQLNIAREVSGRHAPRVMLADEVGMGKTIEAGLILHQQLITERARRVLILVPETLQHQWLVEMLRRFNLHFSLFDEERCRAADADNPFNAEQLILCSLDFISQNEDRYQQALDADWDLMIIDEAHHLIWSEDEPSREYQVVENLSRHIPGLLLLTATPEQMGPESHFARLRLLDPDRFHDLAAYQEEERSYEPVADAVQELLDNDQLPEASCNHLIGFLGDGCKPLIEAINTGSPEECEDARTQLLRNLLDRHGTGRVLFRNTRAAVGGFPGRVVQGYPQEMPELYQIAQEEETETSGSLYPELAYQRHIKVDDMDPWWKVDPRVEWLIDLLKLLKKQKVLVICANADTALDLEAALRVLSGIPAAIFHENMSIVERDRSAAWFADEEYGAQVLVCSEIGSEGRNFQFAHHLVLFDLPGHPDLLEQRIGRLDRIGQTETIKIHVPYITGTSQELMFHWYNHGLNGFADTCPSGSTVYEQLGEEFSEALSPVRNTTLEDIQPLLERTAALNAEMSDHLHNGRDRLLEINSRGTVSAEDLINDIEEQEEPRQLKRYMEKLFEGFGVDSEDHSKHCLVIRPGSHMVTSFPGLPADGCTVTFDREMALSREDMHFLTWEHPMVSESMDLLLTSDMGNTSVALLKNKALKPGTMLLEAIYVIEAAGEKQLQLDRYLPPTPIRCLIDPGKNNLAEKVAFDTLNAQLQPIKKGMAKKLVKAQREPILAMLGTAEGYAKQQVTPIVADACKSLLGSVTEEIKRLAALKAVNPNVRDEEIEHLKLRAAMGHQCLQNAMLRLDAIRLMVAG
ncbi:RNA polymerase-associated protein RapA [Endozoicomonas sp. OPT23]|uniref:RNA polymerase-associated protein RapA n=1 Tax=Endozoicomonas sp. OPT23 TaxID=2072845 RepID=UPI00129B6860|nr:RNA polymerase-associated protein RapA [Endozoicomonas sp. OPT23]MRI34606.1 RNA polymerase-associated protein RapA [Endozoicomonas sp. OPT23]